MDVDSTPLLLIFICPAIPLPQISTVRSEVGQLDSRLTETSAGLRRDVDRIRKEMEDVVLKEMKERLEEVYRRVGQEEAARKLVRSVAVLGACHTPRVSSLCCTDIP